MPSTAWGFVVWGLTTGPQPTVDPPAGAAAGTQNRAGQSQTHHEAPSSNHDPRLQIPSKGPCRAQPGRIGGGRSCACERAQWQQTCSCKLHGRLHEAGRRRPGAGAHGGVHSAAGHRRRQTGISGCGAVRSALSGEPARVPRRAIRPRKPRPPERARRHGRRSCCTSRCQLRHPAGHPIGGSARRVDHLPATLRVSLTGRQRLREAGSEVRFSFVLVV